ncbi:hypothetical protein H0H93_016191 [Arthromyces matolae]|nr:hypothetical protein H0H93_016191 [Arthromyces matolae]
MIITDENAKLLPNNGKKRAAGGSDHETSLTQSSGSAVNPPPYQVYHVQPQVTAQQASSYRSSPARRFWIAFFVAIFVWVLLTTLVESWLNVFSHWSDVSLQLHIIHNVQPIRLLQVFRQGDFPVPSDVSLSQCIIDEKDWSNVPYPSPFPPNSELSARHTGQNYYPYSSSATFELPLSSKSLFLVAKGAQTRGTVNIITSDQVSDVVKVHITVKHISKDVRNRGIKVCLLERPNEIGIGYFTKAWFYPFQHSIYEATVVIPAPAAPVTSRHITAFETDMTNTVHNLGNLQNLSVLADRAIFFTSNGPIKGLYNASRSLSLSTWNAPIHADIALGNEENYVSDLSLQTSNGEIHTRASLTSGSKGGRYMIRAKTSNAPLTFAFPFSPPDSTLRFTASTSNGYARISLNPTYEGLISMITSNGSPSISRREVVDPSGQGRVRRVHTTSLGRNTLKGSVSWSDEEGPSKVELRSSNSPVMIDL